MKGNISLNLKKSELNAKLQGFHTLSLEEKEIFSYDLNIQRLGDCQFESHLTFQYGHPDRSISFIAEDERTLAYIDTNIINELNSHNILLPSFEKAGPRQKLFFEPGDTTSAIVTCGGICPGLNAVIRSLVNMNFYRYNNQRIYGIRYGYEGLIRELGHEVELLTPARVDTIQAEGGTILGTSRGPQDTEKMVNRLVELNVKVLYTIGGDGTLRGTKDIAEEIDKRNLKIAVIGIPKTIDNDVNFIDKSFGMETAFSKACESINAAHTEATSSSNGIGIVKLMGRESGFIAANATLATNQANFCLIPELEFEMDGPNGFLAALEKRILKRKHAVIVVAEGAGQQYVSSSGQMTKDASGNIKMGDIGVYLKNEIKKYMDQRKVSVNIKYIDPSYIVRSCAPTPNDAIFCAQLGQMAVHAGMSGRTAMVVGYRNGQFNHIPIEIATAKRKKIDLQSQLWLSVIESTGQPIRFTNP